MKKIILSVLILSMSSFCWAQNDSIPDTIPDTSDSIENDFTAPITVKSFAPKQVSFLKNGKTKLSHNFRVGFLFGKDEVMTPDLSVSSDDFSDEVEEKGKQGTSYGLNLSYRLTLTPGEMDKKKENFQVNPLGFAYSFGIDISGDLQQNYGFSCDILAAAGIEFGTSKIGFGIDGLVGTGNLSGLMIQEHATNPELSGTYQESIMTLKYGAQIWIKVPSFLGGLFGPQPLDSGRDIRISLRYIMNSIPNEKSAGDFTIFPMFPERGLCAIISFSF